MDVLSGSLVCLKMFVLYNGNDTHSHIHFSSEIWHLVRLVVFKKNVPQLLLYYYDICSIASEMCVRSPVIVLLFTNCYLMVINEIHDVLMILHCLLKWSISMTSCIRSPIIFIFTGCYRNGALEFLSNISFLLFL